jgi:hypothetical protein
MQCREIKLKKLSEIFNKYILNDDRYPNNLYLYSCKNYVNYHVYPLSSDYYKPNTVVEFTDRGDLYCNEFSDYTFTLNDYSKMKGLY